MEKSNELEHSLNEIKSSIDKNDIEMWVNETRSKCFQEASQKLKYENEYLRKDINEMKKRIEELEPLVEMVENINDENVRTITNGYDTIVYHRLYKQKLLEDIKSQNEKFSKILKEYQDHIDYVTQNLERKTPQYKLLQEKKVELRKVQVECKVLEQDIEERKQIIRERNEIRRKRFNAPIIAFAKAWIDRKNYLERMKRWKELTLLEKEWTKKVLDSGKQLKQKQKQKERELSSRNGETMMNLFEPEKDQNLQFPVEVVEAVDDSCSPSYNELKNLIESEQAYSQPSKPSSVDNMAISTKPLYNPNHSKVVVLENKIVKSVAVNKENRRRLIDAEFQKVVKSFSRNHSERKSLTNLGSKMDKNLKMRNNDKPDLNETWNSQDLNNQENSQYLSQESKVSKVSSQGKANVKSSGILQENRDKLNTKLSQTTHQKLAEMRFIPQQQQKAIHSVEAKEGVETTRVKEKQGYEKKYADSNLPGQNNTQYLSQENRKLSGGFGSQFDSRSRRQSLSKINSSQPRHQNSGEVPQGAFFSEGFAIPNNGLGNIQGVTKKTPKTFTPFSNDTKGLFDNKKDSMKAPPSRNSANEGIDKVDFMNKSFTEMDIIDHNQMNVVNANKDGKFIPDMMNFGAGPQFAYGNISELQNDTVGTYDAGLLSPEMDSNFETQDGEAQPNPTYFQFGNTGEGGGDFLW